MLVFLSSTPGFGAPDSQSSQSICVSFQAMATVTPPSSCNSASLSEGSFKGSLDSPDGGRMQLPVSFLSDPALPSNHPSMMHGPSKGLAAVVCESCGMPSEFCPSLGSRQDLRASAWSCSSLLLPKTHAVKICRVYCSKDYRDYSQVLTDSLGPRASRSRRVVAFCRSERAPPGRAPPRLQLAAIHNLW
jgi:hypothetical protein